MRQCRSPFRTTAYALVVALAFSAPSVGYAATPDDPWEIANRQFYFLHEQLDHLFFAPAARAYKAVFPAPVRKGLRNMIHNLKEPGIALNDLLQAHPVRSSRTVARFVINSTAGVAGLMDVAYNVGLKYHDNGFGTTAGRYGIQPGPYLFIPLFGPTSIRDALGSVADNFTDPLAWRVFPDSNQVIWARVVIGGLDQRAEADEELRAIQDMSTDPYASLRSLYEQNRDAEIQDAISGVPGSAQPQLDNFDDPGAPPAAAPAAAPAQSAPAPAGGMAAMDRMVDGMMADMLAKPLAPVAMNARSGALAPVEQARAG